VLTLPPESVWNLVVNDATEDRQFFTCKTLQLVCGLPLCGWAVVAPKRFHFTITELTVDRGSSSRADILQTDLLDRGYPMTVPR
jgi:hypothetical protein